MHAKTSRKILIWVVLVPLVTQPPAAADTTPSHLYQQTANAMAEIEVLRAHAGIEYTDRARRAQTGKNALHVYVKSLEVLEQVSALQRQSGIKPVEIPSIPTHQITARDVLHATRTILKELRRVKKRRGITMGVRNAIFVAGKGMSDVYENMWLSSGMLDGLVGQVSPNNVYRNTEYILNELVMLAPRLGVSPRTDPPPAVEGKSALDANIEGFKNLHKTALLERHLGMDALRVPTFPPGAITSSDVYDGTTMMLAEMIHLNLHFGVARERAPLPVPEGKEPWHVLAQMQLIGENLDAILAQY